MRLYFGPVVVKWSQHRGGARAVRGCCSYASAGRARNGPAQFTGELYALYLLKEYQGRGIGSALFRTVAAQLVTLGMESIIVWALETNDPACQFYRRLGGVPVARSSIDIGGQICPEIAFGWPHLRQLTCDPSR